MFQDLPPCAEQRCARQAGGGAARGMVFCGTGMGVGIIANKFSGVYAATVENEAAARNSRSINNSNVLCMGGMGRKHFSASCRELLLNL